MSKLTKQERKEKQAILNALGVKITIIPPPEFHKTECSICLNKIHKGEQKNIGMRAYVSFVMYNEMGIKNSM